MMNFGTIFDLPLRMWPEKEALIDGPHRLTYAELEQRTNRVANGLHTLGIGSEDHVAVLVKNDLPFRRNNARRAACRRDGNADDDARAL